MIIQKLYSLHDAIYISHWSIILVLLQEILTMIWAAEYLKSQVLGIILDANENGINMMYENNIRRNFYKWKIRSRQKVLLSEDCGF